MEGMISDTNITQQNVQEEAWKPYTLRSMLKDHAKLFAIVFLIYSLVYGFIFRDLLAALPSIWRGDSVLSMDELYPFFNWKTQIWDIVNQDVSVLTNSSEFRFRYFFLTAWLRYFTIMPVAIVLSAITTTFATFVASSFLLTKFRHAKTDTHALLTGAACASLFIYLLLWYAKITNFYTLIIGFSLFSVASVFYLNGLFFSRERRMHCFIAGSLLSLINPAVHFVVMYALIAIVLSIAAMILRIPFQADENENSLRKDIWIIGAGIGCIVLFTLLPYALLAKYFFLRGVGVLQDAIPADYFIMKQGSLPMAQQFAFESTAVLNAFFFGRYLLAEPRYILYFYFGFVLLPLIPQVRNVLLPVTRDKRIIVLLGLFLVLTMWMSAGVIDQAWIPSLPGMISLIARGLFKLPPILADICIKGLYTFMSVLRYPNRFQLGTYFVAIFFMSFGYLYCYRLLDALVIRFRKRQMTAIVTCIACLLFFLPMISDPAYRLAFFSGNMGTFVSPYPTKNLKEIRDTLETLPEGPLLMLPNAEGPKRIVDQNGVSHRFIDKFYIFYLGKPSFVFTNLGSIYNKQKIFMMLRSMSEGKDWWINIFRNMGIRYLVINKESSSTLPGTADIFANFESVLGYQVQHLPEFFEKRAENDSFILYEFTDPQKSDATPTFTSMTWPELEKILSADLKYTVNRKLFLSPDIPQADPGVTMKILTDEPAKAKLDRFALENLKQSFVRADQAMIGLSYDDSIIPSSRFTLYPYTINTIYTISIWNTLNMITKGTFDTLTSTFTGLPKTGRLRYGFSAKETDTYHVYLRATGTKNSISLSLDNHDIGKSYDVESRTTLYQNRLQPEGETVDMKDVAPDALSSLIPQEIVPVSNGFEYFDLGTMHISAGNHWIYLTKKDNNPLVIEGLLIIKDSLVSPINAQ